MSQRTLNMRNVTTVIKELGEATQAAYIELLAFMPRKRRQTQEGQQLLFQLCNIIAESTCLDPDTVQSFCESKADRLRERVRI